MSATGIYATFNTPTSIAVDPITGNAYVADRTGHTIRMITPEGVVTTLAGTGTAGYTNGTGTAAAFSSPYGVALDE